MNRQERKEKALEFNQEVIELFDKGIKAVDISMLKKITRARVYQILALNKPKDDTDSKTA